ncbi:MAG TPA: ferrous iron transporter B [Vicinamibacterales bacterium]|nr:ferrous iron transporter B [Vicinamibacterales bacterium]
MPVSPPPAPAPATVRRILLVGNPNTGKTTLFNRLCGARAKTANFPGTTVTFRIGHAKLDGLPRVQVVDLPGIYALDSDADEARDARRLLVGDATHRRPDVVVVLVDASALERNLMLVGELTASAVPVVVCLNMTDIAVRRGLDVDVGRLAERLGARVVPMIASKGIGFALLAHELSAVLSQPAGSPGPRADLPPTGAAAHERARWAEDVAGAVVRRRAGVDHIDRRTDHVDRLVTHPVAGTAIFVVVMAALFWTLFELAAVPMDLIEATFGTLGGLAAAWLPVGAVRDLVTDGIIGGIAGTVVFLPQIMMLFFLISLLEDTGYLARAAFVNDRFFRRFGLPGHAFVPLLTAHACAIPALMSTRLIPNTRDRLRAILVLPFMSCSARLPVYVLLTSLLFAHRPAMAGLAFTGAFLLGAGAAFVTAATFGRTLVPGRPGPMVLELPTYKWPSLSNALFTARDQGLSFLKTAGTTIFALSVVMWWLSAYPRSAPPADVVALRLSAEAPDLTATQAEALFSDAAAREARAAQSASFAGRLGRFVQPVFAPLGYDWQLTDAILTSFVAREVFVSTMSVLAGSGDVDIETGVITRIRTMTRDDGTPVFTPATSASALVFFVLAMQCLATLAVTRRETGGFKYAAIQLGYMSALAYVAALVVYQGLRVAGVT